MNDLDITFNLLDSYLVQTEEQGHILVGQRRDYRIILEVVRDAMLVRRDALQASAVYDMMRAEFAGGPVTPAAVPPECNIAAAALRLLAPYRTRG